MISCNDSTLTSLGATRLSRPGAPDMAGPKEPTEKAGAGPKEPTGQADAGPNRNLLGLQLLFISQHYISALSLVIL